MTFEEYLVSKKIDSGAFSKNEPEVWATWKTEFDQMHPQSFTAQKLYLINPIRRKYLLKEEVKPQPSTPATVTPASTGATKAKPVMKPKPKFK